MRKIIVFILVLIPSAALADVELISSTSTGAGESYSTSVTALLTVALMGFIPFGILVMSPFLRISIVLSLMRNAIGTTSVPSNKVIATISLILTFFIMQPQINNINEHHYKKYLDDEISEEHLISGSWGVLREFMIDNTKETSMDAVIPLSGKTYESREDLPASVVILAYIVSELSTAFMIAFMCFIPFLIIDLITGVILMSLGMMMVSPMIISLPLKIGFFVVMDGWTLLVSNLARSFAQ